MALSQYSPGVLVREIDRSTGSTQAIPAYAAVAGPFSQGPVGEVRVISSERQLESVFGAPNNSNFEYWFSAAQYLLYGGTVKVIRTDSTTLKNAVSNGTAVKIKNVDDYENNYETGSNTWNWAAKTPGTLLNGVRVYATDAGPDQLAILPAPSSGNEWEFVADEAVTAASGAAGKVYKYSIVLTVESVVGDFTPGTSTTVTIGASDLAIDVIAWDPANKKLEISLPSAGLAGILADAQTITQGTNTADIAASGIERRLYVALNKGSIEFAATDVIQDTDGDNCTVSSVRSEYAEREYLPGVKWINVAARPGTSLYADSLGGHRDEMHIVVVDIDGGITGTTGALLERFIGVSKASDAKTSVGETNYYVEILKQRSDYLYWGEHETGVFNATATASDGNWGLGASARQFNLLRSAAGTVNYPAGRKTVGSVNNATYYYRLTGGADYANSGGVYTVTNTDVATAYELLEDPESQRIDFILAGPSGSDDATAIAKVTSLVNIVEERRDCMVFVSPRRANVIGVSNTNTATDNIIAFFEQLPSSSYMVFDSGYKYIYDKYNDVYRYVPCNGDVAGLCLQTTEVAEPWFSPAGFQRGNLRNAIKLAFSPNKTQRDRLYGSRINPIVSFPGQGVVLFGDKTAQGFASAFDRINVRRLFLTIERVISGAAKSQLFEQNDESQRSLFLNIVEPYLRDVQGRRGVTDFLVKCDSSNNPPEAVDRGEFYAEIFVKPTRTINYITLTFVATRSGVAFNEVAS